MYFTASASVFLVLFLIGMECVLILSSVSVVARFRENAVVTVVISDEADSLTRVKADAELRAMPYWREVVYTSPEEALAQHVDRLGEDPTVFLGFNPLFASYDLHPKAMYAHADSLSGLVESLQHKQYVDQVIYQRDVMDQVEHNIHKASVVLLALALLLLIVAMVLIVNTVRLQIYSKRFLINTMTLVGATAHHIKRPFVWRNVCMGLLSSVLAVAAVVGVLYYAETYWEIYLLEHTWQNLACISAVVITVGVSLTLFATLFATGRYIRMSADTMYEI